MFRIGGSAGEGITSGLAPRQGYANQGSVKQNDVWGRTLGEYLGGDPTLGEIRDLSREAGYKPRGTNVYDFLTEFGLDIASRPPEGGLIATAASAAKKPYERFISRKSEAEAAKYVSEADMFKTLIKAGATATGEEGLAGKTAQWKAEMVPEYLNTIATIGAIPKEDRTKQQKIDLEAAEINLANLSEDNPYIEYFLNNPKLGEALVKKIKAELLMEDQQSANPKYKQELGEDDPQLIIDTFLEFKKEVEKMAKMAKGGRVGYQTAGSVYGEGENVLQGEATAVQDAGMPEELSDISYEELRARLPQEVSDEVVRLLANSAEALEDFATIQTEQDIANFNKKYGVNLVLPAED